MANQFSSSSSSSSSDLDAVSVPEWEIGLPCSDDLTPLSEPLLPPFLAAAFSVSPEHVRTAVDVHLASLQTLASIRHPRAKILEDSRNEGDVLGDSSSSKRRAMARKQRLVWTPQLHGRFVEVVARLGPKDAVPKKIMEMMNVEGLTREHVASHLQKYQLKLKESSSN